MRKLTKAELLEVKDDLFNGRQVSIEIDEFTSDEFNRQLRELEEKEKNKNAEDAKVGGRPASPKE